MTTKDDIENFVAQQPHVKSAVGRAFRAFLGDQRVEVGDLLIAGDTRGRVTRLVGHRTVDADQLWPTPIAAGTPVELRGRAFLPEPAHTTLADLQWAEAGVPPAPLRTATDRRERFEIGWRGVDLIAPLCVGGFNLILDLGTAQLGPIVDALGAQHEATMRAGPSATGPKSVVAPLEHAATALTVVAAWRCVDEASSALIVADVPLSELASVAELANLESTVDQLTTVLVRCPVGDDDARDIAETLTIGTWDTQWVLRPDATIDLSRSRGDRAARSEDRNLAVNEIGRALHLADQRAIFGDVELEPEDIELLARVAALENLELGRFL